MAKVINLGKAKGKSHSSLKVLCASGPMQADCSLCGTGKLYRPRQERSLEESHALVPRVVRISLCVLTLKNRGNCQGKLVRLASARQCLQLRVPNSEAPNSFDRSVSRVSHSPCVAASNTFDFQVAAGSDVIAFLIRREEWSSLTKKRERQLDLTPPEPKGLQISARGLKTTRIHCPPSS